MKHLNRLLALLLVGCVALCLMACNSGEKEKADGGKATAGNSNKKTGEPEVLELAVNEADYAGKWVATKGHNATSDEKKDSDPGITLTLNEDLTGTFTSGGKSVDFTWYYATTKKADNSAFYMDFECVAEDDTVLPGGISFDPFYFSIDTNDTDTMYLTVGDWQYTCKLG